MCPEILFFEFVFQLFKHVKSNSCFAGPTKTGGGTGFGFWAVVCRTACCSCSFPHQGKQGILLTILYGNLVLLGAS